MSGKKKYRRILTDCDTTGFQKLGRGSLQGKGERLYDNLWGMFGLTREVREKHKAETPKDEWPSVTDYAWTEQAKRNFYAHPYHRRFVSQCKKMGGMTWGMWVLDAEPADYEPDNEGSKG